MQSEIHMQGMTIDDVHVAYRTVGLGPAVALLHCSGSSAAQWSDLAELLDGRHHVIAPDLYGCGGTGAWPGRGPIRLADHARMVAAIIRRHGEPVHLVGHSFGGAVALRLALDYPELLSSLALIEPVPFHLLRTKEVADRHLYAEIRAVAASVFECTLNGHSHAGMGGFVDYWNGPGAWARLSPAVQDRLRLQIGGVAANFTALFADATPATDYRAIRVPSLVLRGSDSPQPARRVAELVAEALPAGVLKTVAGAGHMLPLTHATTVAAELEVHIARVRRRGSAAATRTSGTAKLEVRPACG